MKFKQILLVAAISSVTALGSVMMYEHLPGEKQLIAGGDPNEVPVHFAKYTDGFSGDASGPVDFTKAASMAVPAVVHIKTKTSARKVSGGDPDDLLNRMLGLDTYIVPEQRGSGSGVIIREDGYIITNNHVVTDENGTIAEDITVTLNNHKIYKAKLLGRDAANDIALLKINETGLPTLSLGNSDDLQTGQWVLAVGYPFSLEATVTAGIISATGSKPVFSSRTANNNESGSRSFIQTDAAVNVGNSGGALINTKGELIGINSNIVSPTGTYAGYSFAIPVSVVKKAVKDILQTGAIQRGS